MSAEGYARKTAVNRIRRNSILDAVSFGFNGNRARRRGASLSLRAANLYEYPSESETLLSDQPTEEGVGATNCVWRCFSYLNFAFEEKTNKQTNSGRYLPLIEILYSILYNTIILSLT